MVTTTALRHSLNLLKNDYMRSLSELDVMSNRERPRLEILHATRIGVHRLHVMQTRLAVQGLKRKTVLINAALRAGRFPDVAQIQAEAAAGLADAEGQIIAQARRISLAGIRPVAGQAGPRHTPRLRRLFYDMAVHLHPDINPGLTGKLAGIWRQVREAFANGDVSRLLALQEAHQADLLARWKQELSGTNEALSERCAALREAGRGLRAEIAALRNTFPFNMVAQLRDSDWVVEQQGRLARELAALRVHESELTILCDAMLTSAFPEDGEPFAQAA